MVQPSPVSELIEAPGIAPELPPCRATPGRTSPTQVAYRRTGRSRRAMSPLGLSETLRRRQPATGALPTHRDAKRSGGRSPAGGRSSSSAAGLAAGFLCPRLTGCSRGPPGTSSRTRRYAGGSRHPGPGSHSSTASGGLSRRKGGRSRHQPPVRVQEARTPVGSLVHLLPGGRGRVWLRDQKIGETCPGRPLIAPDLAPGTYRLRATKSGHRDWALTVTVAASERREVKIDIQPAAAKEPRRSGPQPGSLSINLAGARGPSVAARSEDRRDPSRQAVDRAATCLRGHTG